MIQYTIAQGSIWSGRRRRAESKHQYSISHTDQLSSHNAQQRRRKLQAKDATVSRPDMSPCLTFRNTRHLSLIFKPVARRAAVVTVTLFLHQRRQETDRQTDNLTHGTAPTTRPVGLRFGLQDRLPLAHSSTQKPSKESAQPSLPPTVSPHCSQQRSPTSLPPVPNPSHKATNPTSQQTPEIKVKVERAIRVPHSFHPRTVPLTFFPLTSDIGIKSIGNHDFLPTPPCIPNQVRT
jgi:hypothetical protein